jgi:hypothetical protein
LKAYICLDTKISIIKTDMFLEIALQSLKVPLIVSLCKDDVDENIYLFNDMSCHALWL